jgi:two-component system response regulator RegX3
MTKKSLPEERIKVLIVEDEESFIDALTVGLEREGFDVAIARDGQQGLAAFNDGHFDVVLLDLMLPKMSGLDVTRSIRGSSNVPIIIVSAKGEEVDMVLMLEIGTGGPHPRRLTAPRGERRGPLR